MNYFKRLPLSTLTFMLFMLLSVACGDSPSSDAGGDSGVDSGGGDAGGEEASIEDLAGIAVLTQPSSTVAAGTGFTVAFELVDDAGNTLELEGIDLTVELNRNQFDDGTTSATASTNASGVAEFTLVIEAADTGLALTATSGQEGLEDASVTTSFFDVVAAEADPDTSSISGTEGIVSNETPSEITIELIDGYGNPLVGLTPEFAASGEGNSYGECSETDEAGIATCTMTSTEAGPKTLEITQPAEVVGDTIEFVAWDCDEAGAPFGGGNGSTEEPYRLCTSEHLGFLGTSRLFLEDAFVLARSIDMAGVEDFDIIGTADEPFTGHFDGVANTIDNLVIARPTESDVGLFASIGEEGVVENLVIENLDVQGEQRAGGLAGTNLGTITASRTAGSVVVSNREAGGLVGVNRGVVTGSSFQGDVDGVSLTGGLSGYNYGTIEDSNASSSVFGSHSYAGGLVGFSEGSIGGSYATGDVEGEDLYVGGLVGSNIGSIEGSHSESNVVGAESYTGGFVGYNTGTLHSSYAQGDVEGMIGVGGFVGVSGSGSSITEAYATGSVVGRDNVGGFAGGFLGNDSIEPSRVIVEDSYATGAVEGSDYRVGGFVGTNSYSDISNAYATGDVVGVGDNVGGFVAYSNAGSIITGCHATGRVEGMSENVGGFAGRQEEGEIINSYATGNVVGVATRIGGLVGSNLGEGHISGSFASGTVDAREAAIIGGLVGRHQDGTITDCYATGDVLAGDRGNVGGLVGFQQGGSIARSYASGLVQGEGIRVGGLLGGGLGTSNSESYWDEETSEISESYSGDRLSTAEFADEANFETWDFEDGWIIGTAPDGEERPVLRWQ